MLSGRGSIFLNIRSYSFLGSIARRGPQYAPDEPSQVALLVEVMDLSALTSLTAMLFLNKVWNHCHSLTPCHKSSTSSGEIVRKTNVKRNVDEINTLFLSPSSRAVISLSRSHQSCCHSSSPFLLQLSCPHWPILSTIHPRVCFFYLLSFLISLTIRKTFVSAYPKPAFVLSWLGGILCHTPLVCYDLLMVLSKRLWRLGL